MPRISSETQPSGADEGERPAAAPTEPARNALVFLVEDDEAVRDAVATSLRSAGFAVLAFGSARQFLDTYRTGQRGCLVVDVDLPDVEPELLPMLATSELVLPAVITSRRLQRRTLVPALRTLRVMLLDKPFGIDDLVPLVRDAITADDGETERKCGIPPT